MKRAFLPLIILLFCLSIIGCKKDPQEILTPMITNDKVEFSSTSVTFTWTVDWPGKLISVVEVSESEDMSGAIRYGSEEETENHDFSVTVTGLEDGSKYYYRYVVWNKYYVDKKFMMEVKSFTTVALYKPTVTTASVNQINFTNATAAVGGEVTSDGGDAVTERGIYYGTSPDPANTGTKLVASSAGMGSFTCTMTELVEGTAYYICAYATNGKGTSYGNEKRFNFGAPAGAIRGVFSVSSNKKAYFSQGNLQYNASTNTWQFAANQYDCIGSDNSNISSSYSGWIDLFGWGTSGYNHGAACYQPWSTSRTNSDYYAYGQSGYNLFNQTGKADWGYNPISNGGNTTKSWQTLTKDEWVYVIQGRSGASSKYGHGNVNGRNGVILLPDDWTKPSGLSFIPGNSSWSNSYTTQQWSQMEANGAIFLPAAGYRYLATVVSVDEVGYYWSASYESSSSASEVGFRTNELSPFSFFARFYGFSVRLVTPVVGE